MKHKILISIFIIFLSFNSKAQQVVNDDGDLIKCTDKVWTRCEKPATFYNSDSINIYLLKNTLKNSGITFYGSITFEVIVNINGEIIEVYVTEININNPTQLKALFKQINYKFNAAMQNGRKVCFFQNVKISITDEVYEVKCLK